MEAREAGIYGVDIKICHVGAMDMRTQVIDKTVVVSSIEGNVQILLADGSSRPLQKGEILQPGAVIPPFFGALKSRGHAACAKRCFGV